MSDFQAIRENWSRGVNNLQVEVDKENDKSVGWVHAAALPIHTLVAQLYRLVKANEAASLNPGEIANFKSIAEKKIEYYHTHKFKIIGYIKEIVSKIRNLVLLGEFKSSGQMGLELANNLMNKDDGSRGEPNLQPVPSTQSPEPVPSTPKDDPLPITEDDESSESESSSITSSEDPVKIPTSHTPDDNPLRNVEDLIDDLEGEWPETEDEDEDVDSDGDTNSDASAIFGTPGSGSSSRSTSSKKDNSSDVDGAAGLSDSNEDGAGLFDGDDGW